MYQEQPSTHSGHGVAPSSSRASWSVNDWCAEAGIGRVRCYEELKIGRIKAKKCGSRTLITTSPAEWLESLPDLAAA